MSPFDPSTPCQEQIWSLSDLVLWVWSKGPPTPVRGSKKALTASFHSHSPERLSLQTLQKVRLAWLEMCHSCVSVIPVVAVVGLQWPLTAAFKASPNSPQGISTL